MKPLMLAPFCLFRFFLFSVSGYVRIRACNLVYNPLILLNE
jgi:hypothetical protein